MQLGCEEQAVCDKMQLWAWVGVVGTQQVTMEETLL